MKKNIYFSITLILIWIITGSSLAWGRSNALASAQSTPVPPLAQALPTRSPAKYFLPLINTHLAYYVSPAGNDSNPGSFDRPWRTFQKANNMVVPGVPVYIRGGVYNQVLKITKSGTQNTPVIFTSYPGEQVIIDGENERPTSYGDLIEITGDYVLVSGIEVRNSTYRGVGLHGRHDTVNNLFVHHSQKSGIYIFGDYGTVENSRIWYNSISNEFGKAYLAHNTWSSGISAARDSSDGITENAVIRNNEIWENWGEGLSTFEANQIVLENNIVHDNYSANIYISDATNVLCNRNFVYRNESSVVNNPAYGGHNTGIMMGDETYKPASANIIIINNITYGTNRGFYWWQGERGGGMVNVLVANNTFVNSFYGAGISIGDGPHQNVYFENNIIQQDGDLHVIYSEFNSEVHYSHNIWSKKPSSFAQGEGDLIVDPQLLKTGSPFRIDWFRLASTSPAINKAVPLPQVAFDFFNNWRGKSPDIGAVEFRP